MNSERYIELALHTGRYSVGRRTCEEQLGSIAFLMIGV
jgi:hypothetical protein